MKLLNFPSVFLLFFSLILLGCSGGGGSDDSGDEITSITLASNATTILTNQSVTFTVVSNTSQNLTSASTITVNGSAITGNTYTPTTSGSYSVKATYNSFTSNTITLTVNESITSITLSANDDEVYQGENIVFSVTGNGGENLTSQSQISHNGIFLANPFFTTTSTGSLEFVATYNELTSNTLQINVLEPPTTFNQRVLIEDYTGTWCQFCPRVSFAIELVRDATDDASFVAIHNGDEMSNSTGNSIANAFGVTGLPTAMLNRTTEWNFPEPNNVGQVTGLTDGQSNVGLAISPTLNGTTMEIDVNVKFGGLYNQANSKLVVYLVEDKLYYNQTNSTSYYSGNPLVNFEHNEVFRSSLTHHLGDAIPSSEVFADNIYTKSFNVTVPGNVVNTSNMSVVAFVVKANNQVINVRTAHFGDTQTFEEL